jgi:hypothetical protein
MRTPRIGIWLRGFVLVLTAIWCSSDSLGQTGAGLKELRFFTKLGVKGKTAWFDVYFQNTGSRPLGLGMGDCDMTFAVVVAGKKFTAPWPNVFGFPDTCTLALRLQSVPAHSTQLVRTYSPYKLDPLLVKALFANKLKYTGEFRFRFRVQKPGQSTGEFLVLIYKTP